MLITLFFCFSVSFQFINMHIKFLFIVVILLFWSLKFSAQPESAVYKDLQESYKSGLEFYRLSLFGKAQAQFDKVLGFQSELYLKQNTDQLYFQKAELYSALSALRLEHVDAEKRLLLFIAKNEPSAIASMAKLEVGHYYYAKRDYDNAIQFLSGITWSELGDMENSEVVNAKFELGYCYFVKKQFQKAGQIFQQIRGTDSKYAENAQYYYGLCAFYQKDYKVALEAFTLIDKSRRYVDIVPSYIVQIQFMLKNYDEVINYGEPLLKNPEIKERNTILQAVGQSYFEKGKYKEALPHIEEYVEKTPKVTEDVFYQLAYAQYRSARFEEAVANFEQINSLNNLMGQNALYNQANCQLKLNKKKEAMFNFEQASLKDFDKNIQTDALMNYAKLAYQLGLDNDAISAFMKIPASSKYYNESQNLLSKLFLNTREYDKALDILRNIPQRSPSLNETYQKVVYLRGIMYYKDEDYQKAIELFNEALKNAVHTETTTLCHYWKAEALFHLDKNEESIKEYDKFILMAGNVNKLPDNSSKGTAYYGIAYNYIKTENYIIAGKNFEYCFKFIEEKLKNTNDKYVSNFVYPDAILRAADCYMFLGTGNRENYLTAGKYYSKILENNYPESDYALYQLNLIYYVTENIKKQEQYCDKMISKFPNSPFADDALFQKGSALLSKNESADAKKAFELLVEKYPESEYYYKALNRLGRIAYGQGREREALDYFKAVASKNIQSEEAKDAIIYIRKIYVESGDPDGFLAYVSTIKGYDLSDMSADSLLYESADKKFDSESWEDAAEIYTKYLSRFPNGMNNLSSYNNRGICYYNLKSYEKALSDFENVIDARNPTAPNDLAENSSILAARICYHITEDFSKALKYFKTVEKLTNQSDIKNECRLFGMRSAYYSDNIKELGSLSENYLKESTTTAQNKAEAHFYHAKFELSNKSYDAARKNFEEAIKLVNDDIRASESRYRIAQIYYLQKKLDKALELAFQNNKQLGNHHDWLARNFILISDIYVEQDNPDAAKGTLESLLKNYNGDAQIVAEAKAKLEKIKNSINTKSRLKSNNDDEDLEMIEDGK
jgi:tetratricopeptide (TPR) repeat protein